jgi:cyclophilin family peptidyl-prolyl cis-trans isomerase
MTGGKRIWCQLRVNLSAVAMLSTSVVAAQPVPPKPALAPSEIVAAAPASDWVAIAPSDLLVMDLAPNSNGSAKRVVIQLMPPPFSQGWVGNIRKLAAAHWWDGTSINRVQDNYVVQWGDANGEDKAKAKPLPDLPESGKNTHYAVVLDAKGYLSRYKPPPETPWRDSLQKNGLVEIATLTQQTHWLSLVGPWQQTEKLLGPSTATAWSGSAAGCRRIQGRGRSFTP